MEPVLFGLTRDKDTDSARTMLHDSGKPFRYVDIAYAGSPVAQAIQAITNSDTIPVLIHKGVTYIGLESVRKHSRERL